MLILFPFFQAENWPDKDTREPFKLITDPDVVKAFLKGEHCLYGGAGWWKYEFCFGKKKNNRLRSWRRLFPEVSVISQVLLTL